jgi:hypothetical protein
MCGAPDIKNPRPGLARGLGCLGTEDRKVRKKEECRRKSKVIGRKSEERGGPWFDESNQGKIRMYY